MSRVGAELTISAVADDTGVSESGLRSWELRYGFPAPRRLPSGHRRYTHEEVEQIRQVLLDRDAGISLETAIARVRTRLNRVEPSLFAGLRQRWPDLPVVLISKRAMLAISRAIEDECCAQAERPLLLGSFQTEQFYGHSKRRWNELARTAGRTVVFAEFSPGRRLRRDRIVEVALPDDALLRREWAVVCDAPGAAACLAGVELPGAQSDDRRFEAVWSIDPAVVHDAATIGVNLARSLGETVDPPTASLPVTDLAAAVRTATAVTSRIVTYLDR